MFKERPVCTLLVEESITFPSSKDVGGSSKKCMHTDRQGAFLQLQGWDHN